MARVAVFVDGGYVDSLGRWEFGETSIDLNKLAEEVRATIAANSAEPLDLLRTFYYHCPPYQSAVPTEEESARYAGFRRYEGALRRLPRFEVRLGRLQYQGNDASGKPIFQQKRVDLMLGIDLALLSGKRQITHIALVAGDGDFFPAFEAAKQEGISVWLFHGPSRGRDGNATYSRDLWQQADERVEIDGAFIARIKRV